MACSPADGDLSPKQRRLNPKEKCLFETLFSPVSNDKEFAGFYSHELGLQAYRSRSNSDAGMDSRPVSPILDVGGVSRPGLNSRSLRGQPEQSSRRSGGRMVKTTAKMQELLDGSPKERFSHMSRSFTESPMQLGVSPARGSSFRGNSAISGGTRGLGVTDRVVVRSPERHGDRRPRPLRRSSEAELSEVLVSNNSSAGSRGSTVSPAGACDSSNTGTNLAFSKSRDSDMQNRVSSDSRTTHDVQHGKDSESVVGSVRQLRSRSEGAYSRTVPATPSHTDVRSSEETDIAPPSPASSVASVKRSACDSHRSGRSPDTKRRARDVDLNMPLGARPPPPVRTRVPSTSSCNTSTDDERRDERAPSGVLSLRRNRIVSRLKQRAKQVAALSERRKVAAAAAAASVASPPAGSATYTDTDVTETGTSALSDQRSTCTEESHRDKVDVEKATPVVRRRGRPPRKSAPAELDPRKQESPISVGKAAAAASGPGGSGRDHLRRSATIIRSFLLENSDSGSSDDDCVAVKPKMGHDSGDDFVSEGKRPIRNRRRPSLSVAGDDSPLAVRKNTSTSVQSSEASTSHSRRGRPPRTQSADSVAGSSSSCPPSSIPVKRGPGRPPKQALTEKSATASPKKLKSPVLHLQRDRSPLGKEAIDIPKKPRDSSSGDSTPSASSSSLPSTSASPASSVIDPNVITKSGGIRKRAMRCGKCGPCLTEKNCGTCVNCLDKREFGGNNIKKQACKLRKCLNPIMPIILRKSSLPPSSPRSLADVSGPRVKKKSLKVSLMEEAEREYQEEVQRQLQAKKARDKIRQQRPNTKMADAERQEQQAAAREIKRLKKIAEARRQSVVEEEKKSSVSSSAVPNTKRRSATEERVLESLPTHANLSSGCGQARIVLQNRDSLTAAEALEEGFAVTMLKPVHFPVCYLCGSCGRPGEELRFCAVCCEPVHQFCQSNCAESIGAIDLWPDDPSSLIVCVRCQVCVVCNGQSLPTASLLKCAKCVQLYHPTCLPPQHPNKARRSVHDSPSKEGPSWLCPRCILCTSCGAFSGAWSSEPETCSLCHKRRLDGHFCTICNCTYPDDDFSLAMVFCGECSRWIHASCQNLTNEQYQILGELPEEAVTFVCTVCRPTSHPEADPKQSEWALAVQVEVRTGIQKVFAACRHTLAKCKDFEQPKWPPPGRSQSPGLDLLLEASAAVDSTCSGMLSLIGSKVEDQIYRTIGEFHADILKFLELLGQHPKAYEFVSVLRTNFCRTMRKIFPWYEVNRVPCPDGGSNIEGPTRVKRKSRQPDPARGLPRPSIDHAYAQDAMPEAATLAPETQPQEVADASANTDGTSRPDIVALPGTAITPDSPEGSTPSSEPVENSSSVAQPADPTNLVTPSSESRSGQAESPASADTTALTVKASPPAASTVPPIYGLPQFDVDDRVCGFCGVVGDAELQGRLMICTPEEWVHFHCALWSSEVYERDDGTLMQVQTALTRARHLHCEICQQGGASVGCCHGRCPRSFHFHCARENQCLFLENKNVFCKEHATVVKSRLSLPESEFKTSRRVVVDLGKLRALRRFQFGMLPDQVRLTVGGLSVLALGEIRPSSDRDTYLLPVGFTSQRLFWSVKSPGTLCVYTCTIVEVTAPGEKEEERLAVPIGHDHAASHSVIAHDDNVASDGEDNAAFDEAMSGTECDETDRLSDDDISYVSRLEEEEDMVVSADEESAAESITSYGTFASRHEDELGPRPCNGSTSTMQPRPLEPSDVDADSSEKQPGKVPSLVAIAKEGAEQNPSLSSPDTTTAPVNQSSPVVDELTTDVRCKNASEDDTLPGSSTPTQLNGLDSHMESPRKNSLSNISKITADTTPVKAKVSVSSMLSPSSLELLGSASDEDSVDLAMKDAFQVAHELKIATTVNGDGSPAKRGSYQERATELWSAASMRVRSTTCKKAKLAYVIDLQHDLTTLANTFKKPLPPSLQSALKGASLSPKSAAEQLDMTSNTSAVYTSRSSVSGSSASSEASPVSSSRSPSPCGSLGNPDDLAHSSLGFVPISGIDTSLAHWDGDAIGTWNTGAAAPLEPAGLSSLSISAATSGVSLSTSSIRPGGLSFARPHGNDQGHPALAAHSTPWQSTELINVTGAGMKQSSSLISDALLSSQCAALIKDALSTVSMPAVPRSNDLLGSLELQAETAIPTEVSSASGSNCGRPHNQRPSINNDVFGIVPLSDSSSVVSPATTTETLSLGESSPTSSACLSPLTTDDVARSTGTSSEPVVVTLPVGAPLFVCKSSSSPETDASASSVAVHADVNSTSSTTDSSQVTANQSDSSDHSAGGTQSLPPLSRQQAAKPSVCYSASRPLSRPLSTVTTGLVASVPLLQEPHRNDHIVSVVQTEVILTPAGANLESNKYRKSGAFVPKTLRGSARFSGLVQPQKDFPVFVPQAGCPVTRVRITSSDGGFSAESYSVEEVWQQLVDAVTETHAAHRLPFANIGRKTTGLSFVGLQQERVVRLLEQFPSISQCPRYQPRFYQVAGGNADAHIDLPLKENPHGCARAEVVKQNCAFDMFNFLSSRYRQRPTRKSVDVPGSSTTTSTSTGGLASVPESSDRGKLTSLDLPLPMRFRQLKKTVKNTVDVFRSEIHGRGLFAKRDIEAQEMVIEYSGQLIRSELTDKREKMYENRSIGCYMFRIDRQDVVDATMCGNAARFINHSCDPNCYSKIVVVDAVKKIVIFAARRILCGEELTYDYKFAKEDDKIPCTCGAENCRKYLN